MDTDRGMVMEIPAWANEPLRIVLEKEARARAARGAIAGDFGVELEVNDLGHVLVKIEGGRRQYRLRPQEG